MKDEGGRNSDGSGNAGSFILHPSSVILPDRWQAAWETRQANFPPEIEFDYPLDTAVLSLTGEQCALDCAHCGGRYLKQMQAVWSVSAESLDGAKSCLVSGGCDPDGRVPVGAHLAEVARLRERPGPRLAMNWHVGLIDRAEMERIAPYVDLISFDVVGDNETIQEVYGLRKSVADYVDTYRMLAEYTRVVPHLTIGLKGGEIAGERRALELIAGFAPETLVLLVLIPTAGTRYADRQPPAVDEVAEVILEARLAMPRTAIYLGCMRPHGQYRAELDSLAVRAGVQKIVSPAREAVRLAGELGLEVREGRECCAILSSQMIMLPRTNGSTKR